MNSALPRFSLVLLVLVSSMFFPSAQQAFADTDVTVTNGQTMTIESGNILSITGILTIQSGGKLIVEEGAIINIDGTGPNNGIINLGEIEQHGTINFVNISALFLINNGEWTIICGTLNNDGINPQGNLIVVESCNQEIILDIPGGVIPVGTTYTVDDQGGKTVVLNKNLIIFGTLVNDGFLSNRALITVKSGGLVDLSDGGEIENVCGNYQSRGITGNGQISPNNVSTLICQPPQAINDNNYSTPEDSTYLVNSANGVLSNDTPGNNDNIPGNNSTLSAFLKSSTTKGSIIFNIDGSFQYKPNLNYNGPDSFSYNVKDGNGGLSNTATVHITVTPTPDPPVANDDSATTLEDTPVTISVLNNDTSPDGYTLSIASVTNGAHGLTSISGTAVIYSPALNYNGPDSFTYTISDGNGGTDTATVTVTVTPVNDPPVANDDSATTLEDTPVTIDVLNNDTSPDGNTISITDVSTASNGIASTDGTTITYVPNQHFTSSDSFTYTISDGNGGTATATVTVTVTNTNDAPLISILSPLDNAVFLIGESVDFTGSATDEEDGILSSNIQWFSDKAGLIGTGESFTISNLSEGVHVISSTIIDSQGSVTTESITITIQVDLENQLFCDDLTISQLLEKANHGKYNLIDNRENPSTSLEGTDDADLILAGNFGDLIKAKGGNDCVIGGSGNDDIRGQEGNDELFGLGGDDTIRGNNGNDLLDGGNGGDDLGGGEGNDKLIGGNDGDNLAGGAGNDELIGGDGNDELIGGDGSDTLKGGDGNDKIEGGDGDDTIAGGAGNDKLDGGAEDDIITGGAGNDDIKGGDGDDDLKGQKGDDTLKGEKGIDSLNGGADNDSCYEDYDDSLLNCEILKSDDKQK